MATALEKNIQLSEKLEYMLSTGRLTLNTNQNNQTVYVYVDEKINCYVIRTGGRLIDFVNDTVEAKGLYPMVQRFQANKNKTKTFEKV